MNGTTDPYAERNVTRLCDRAAAGQAQYGTTLARTDLSTDQWITHAVEEALDLANYLERLRDEVAAKDAENKRLRGAIDKLKAGLRAVQDDLLDKRKYGWMTGYDHLVIHIESAIAAAKEAARADP